MKITRKQLRKLILQEMSMRSQDSDELGQQNVFSIRLLSPGTAYFMDSQQITGEIESMIDSRVLDEDTGMMDMVELARIAKQMGASYIKDQSFQEMGREDLYRPIPVDEYISIVSGG
tara:strand:- start:88 stop:438 length:351 start_codon:yes stop_codon:yes gene_type:complete